MNQFSTFFRDTLVFFKTHFVPLCALIFPLAIPLYFIKMLIIPINEKEIQISSLFLFLLIELIVSPILTAVIFQYIVSVFAGKQITIKALYRFAFNHWGKLILLSVFTTASTIGGALLFVVPGVIVASRLLFAQIECVLHDKSAQDAFVASWNETKDYQWLLVFSLLLFVLGTGGIAACISFVLNGLGLWLQVTDFVINILQHFFSCFAVIYVYRVFSDYEKKLKDQNEMIDH